MKLLRSSIQKQISTKKGDSSGLPIAYIIAIIILLAFLAFMFFFMRSNDSHMNSLSDMISNIFRLG